MRLKQYINEGKESIVKAKLYYNPKDYEVLYTMTDGKGNFTLSNDKSVNWSNREKDVSSVNGKPSHKNLSYDVMEFMGKLGIFDSNMKPVKTYKNMKDLVKNIEDDIQDLGIEIDNKFEL